MLPTVINSFVEKSKLARYLFPKTLLSHFPVKGALPVFTSVTRLVGYRFCSFEEFQEWSSANSDKIAQWEKEDLDAVAAGRGSFTVPGRCAICDEAVEFVVLKEASRNMPNWRENLTCPNCKLWNRLRAAIQLGIQDLGLDCNSDIYITEQFGYLYRWLRGRFRNLRGSEFLPPGFSSLLRLAGGVNHQDIQAMSLPSDSIDYVLTFDVLEHIPDPDSAFRNFARVLRSGGRLIMTAPFTVNKYDSTIRAVMRDDGSIENLLPVEVHGNPTDPEGGSLCYRHFGWDVLDHLLQAGFVDSEVILYHNRDLGYLGGLQALMSAVKP